MVQLLDGSALHRADLTDRYLHLYADETACWMCGVAVGPKEANYTVYEAAHPLGRGRTCTLCVADRSLPGHAMVAARYTAITGDPMEVAAPMEWVILRRVTPLMLTATEANIWQAYAPGAPTRWAHVDAAPVRAAADRTRAEHAAAHQEQPHPERLACGICGTQTSVGWTGMGFRVGPDTRFGVCKECEPIAEHDLGSRPDEILRAACDLRRSQHGSAGYYGITEYAYAVDHPSWPDGTGRRFGHLPEDLPDQVRARWPQLTV